MPPTGEPAPARRSLSSSQPPPGPPSRGPGAADRSSATEGAATRTNGLETRHRTGQKPGASEVSSSPEMEPGEAGRSGGAESPEEAAGSAASGLSRRRGGLSRRRRDLRRSRWLRGARLAVTQEKVVERGQTSWLGDAALWDWWSRRGSGAYGGRGPADWRKRARGGASPLFPSAADGRPSEGEAAV